ncbi:MAG: regulatory protein RecX [Parcubacteria group bacterium]|nr:regulatory protein RecX [Parcubacteria group bacterium]
MSDKKYQAAFDYALRLLSRYPRTVHEIRTKLAQKKYQPDTIDRVLAELANTGQLDDQAYTTRWLEAQLQNRPCGRLLCRKKLGQRGIATELIDQALDEHYPPEKELELAQKMARQKKEILSTRSDKKNRQQKVAFYLKNKGFPGNVIYEVLN